MSGHSRWSQVKHKKAISDAKRGQLFSKMVREIMVAVKEGGPNPDGNQRLRSALERAKEAGLPKENIERAIDRAEGRGEAGTLNEFLYEAVGPYGVYILIDGITDNKNRSLAEIKTILGKHGAKLVPAGSLLWGFEKIWTGEGKDYRPKTPMELAAGDLEKLAPLLDELVEQDDVQEVYTNLSEEIPPINS